MPQPTIITGKTRNDLGEGPLWDSLNACLWWVDVARGSLWRWDHSSAEVSSWPLPKRPTSLALSPGGALLIVFRRQVGFLKHPGAGVRLMEMSDLLGADERFNDCTTDRDGCLWLGTMDLRQERPIAGIFRFGPDSYPTRVAEGFVVTNGMEWSGDGRTLYVIDSARRKVLACRFAQDGGAILSREVVREYPDGELPDGMTIDGDDGLWIAVVGGARVDRLSTDGRHLGSVQVPTPNPTSCTFGAPDLDQLFVTSLRSEVIDPTQTDESNAGAVFCIRAHSSGRPSHIAAAGIGRVIRDQALSHINH